MTFVVKENEPFDPMCVGFVGSRAAMPQGHYCRQLIHELWL